MKQLYAIKVAARRSGLTTHAIRVWEKRYSAVVPDRTSTNRRLYSEDEIERLRLLKGLTELGHAISQLAPLSTEKLKSLTASESPEKPKTLDFSSSIPPEHFVAECVASVKRLEAKSLEDTLNRAAVVLGQAGLLRHVIVPLIQEIGDLWRMGTLKASHEHVATAVIRTFLGNFSRPHSLPDSAPRMLVTTPAGQVHELGAVLVAAAATHQGWRVTYLGPSLPSEEIVGAAVQDRAKVVCLSIVYPEDDPNIFQELRRLRQLLPAEVIIMVGGRAAPSYLSILHEINATIVTDLVSFYEKLEGIRRSPASSVQ